MRKRLIKLIKWILSKIDSSHYRFNVLLQEITKDRFKNELILDRMISENKEDIAKLFRIIFGIASESDKIEAHRKLNEIYEIQRYNLANELIDSDVKINFVLCEECGKEADYLQLGFCGECLFADLSEGAEELGKNYGE